MNFEYVNFEYAKLRFLWFIQNEFSNLFVVIIQKLYHFQQAIRINML